LAETYQPVGGAEQLEVERIAACWWKLGRAWRYENAEIALGHAAAAMRGHNFRSQSTFLLEDKARLALLRRAETEIEATGGISDELKGKIFAPEFREQWDFLEKLTKEQFGGVLARMGVRRPVAKQLAKDPTCLFLATTKLAILFIEHKNDRLIQSASKSAHDQVARPENEALDRVLRADAAADRNLNRAIDRLENLQRRRRGEAVPSPQTSV
jgi:hypothetical protein